ncbi:hypothetical protein N7499_012202 [Penicillium canescens]|uniref:Uncharacterized protein n=1 Tax=Penicillium canescens TaxID=5083 RepID=A0AAD6I329_PENCN|nr:uncharacterized protein N7446_001149 [Penicillium canescens]XP_058378898.1 uncharacterized protein N7446_001155 [Penicillium canescens]XP_058378901.1 uncharacterized protein N7446_001161 [Penicillium canescens]XP_058378904.1 uncharacterized protein N7446_001167 [Penicillium canescens]XP_058378907.1 uncharacterized protein N7446_001173 [Penicillium canescens]XP_058378910.1 uncharacterized protein N7446_001179 [Penicillium canescens]XP_058378913.1 uncharacterized protein N7446_001185 [Penici
MLARAIINALTNIQLLAVNWSVRRVPRIASPGHIGTPPRPTFLTQSPKATSKVNCKPIPVYNHLNSSMANASTGQ